MYKIYIIFGEYLCIIALAYSRFSVYNIIKLNRANQPERKKLHDSTYNK